MNEELVKLLNHIYSSGQFMNNEDRELIIIIKNELLRKDKATIEYENKSKQTKMH